MVRARQSDARLVIASPKTRSSKNWVAIPPRVAAALTKQASPRITLHDLRHLAATLSITAGTPLTVVSKTLRHSTLSTTANLYSHLTQQAAHDAVDAIDTALLPRCSITPSG
ncbi:integrase [Streptomyces sparsogenes DSM 40356]|uniref:Integrase n=1 Tax=Streptomyces sparsogenes DSM 40356 TaxID=1331668 RepID=A0A1R1SET6_9ACTN|nr:integrase [Streptomyces sparsogenes DSM 40356]